MDENFLKDLEVPFNTPDLCELEYQKHHLLFDCRVRKTSNVLCSAYTVERMSLLVRNEDHLPLPIRLPGLHKARVGGALYKVTPQDIVELDKSRQNRLQFERRRIEIIVPFLDEDKQLQVLPVEVLHYQAIPDVWEERIDMCQRKYNMSPENPDISWAKTHLDNERLLNNHFRLNPKRVEDYFDKPTPRVATPEVLAYVKKKNEEAVAISTSVYNIELRKKNAAEASRQRAEAFKRAIWRRNPK